MVNLFQKNIKKDDPTVERGETTEISLLMT